jgi:hypothetical protein
MSAHTARLEARVSALERRELNLEVHVEEISNDVTTSFKQLSDDMIAGVKRLADDMTASFKQQVAYEIETEKQIDTRFNKIEADIAEIKGDVANIKAIMATKYELAEVKATMATKEDLAAAESRILDAFKQLLVTVNAQHPAS